MCVVFAKVVTPRGHAMSLVDDQSRHHVARIQSVENVGQLGAAVELLGRHVDDLESRLLETQVVIDLLGVDIAAVIFVATAATAAVAIALAEQVGGVEAERVQLLHLVDDQALER